MDAPPAYPPMPMKPRSNTKLIWGIVIGVVAVCCIGVGFLLFTGYRMVQKVMPLFVCGYKFQDIRAATLHYANAHGGKLPNAKTWQDDIQPDLKEVLQLLGKSKRPFGTVKPGEEFACTVEADTTGIAFNSDLSEKKLDDIKSKQDAILIYEIRSQMHNASGPYKPNPDAAPKIMDAPRGWFSVAVEGKVSVDFAGRKKIVFDEDAPHVVNSDGSSQ